MENRPNIPTFEEMVYGEKHYKTILQVLRDSLSIGLNSKLKEKYGAIAFFKYDTKSEGINMNFFPLFPEVIDLNFPDDQKIKLEYLQKIYEDRPVSQIYYIEHFRKTYNCSEHTVLEVENDFDLLNHTKESINGLSWTEFIKQNNLEINTLDFLFFKKRQKTFTLFPLPVLCSPCILLFLPYNDKLGIEDLAPLVRDAINNYVFNRLMNEIRSDLKPAAIPNREAFIKRFVDEFNQVALPIKFEFKGEEQDFIDWYGKFKTDDAAEFELNLDGEIVKFFLPSFCWHTGGLLHTLPHYKVKEQQVKETIQNIFELVFGHWKTLNSKKLLVQSEISPLINELRESVAGIKAMKLKVEDKIAEQSQKVETLSKLVIELGGDTTQPFENEFYYTKKTSGEKTWKIRYKGTDVVVGADDKGYEGLHFIIANKNSEIDVAALGADGFYVQQSIRDPDIEKSLINYKTTILEIEKRIKNGRFIADEKGFKIYADNLAGYINCCKDLGNGKSYADEKRKLNVAKNQLKKWMTDEAFNEYENKLENVAKQAKRSSLNKLQQDGILNPIRQLVSRLKVEHEGILAPLLEKSILKIGVKSSFKPKGELDVIWKLTEWNNELE